MRVQVPHECRVFNTISKNCRPLDRSTLAPCVSSLSRRAAALNTIGCGLNTVTSAMAGTSISAAIFAASAAAASDPQSLVRSGMRKFIEGDVEGSVADFDAALKYRPYLWQRGLSLYYIGTEEALQEGAKQFRLDVAFNPNDTEEAIWTYLCESKLVGPEKARKNFLTVGTDSRPVMRVAYLCFKNGADPSAILSAAQGDTTGHAAFYANLYTGLWYEAHGNEEKARKYVTIAEETAYSRQSGDYMADLARVHLQRRGWSH